MVNDRIQQINAHAAEIFNLMIDGEQITCIFPLGGIIAPGKRTQGLLTINKPLGWVEVRPSSKQPF